MCMKAANETGASCDVFTIKWISNNFTLQQLKLYDVSQDTTFFCYHLFFKSIEFDIDTPSFHDNYFMVKVISNFPLILIVNNINMLEIAETTILGTR